MLPWSEHRLRSCAAGGVKFARLFALVKTACARLLPFAGVFSGTGASCCWALWLAVLAPLACCRTLGPFAPPGFESGHRGQLLCLLACWPFFWASARGVRRRREKDFEFEILLFHDWFQERQRCWHGG